jgi:predicted anti-sigma-YlaC factor YlaD
LFDRFLDEDLSGQEMSRVKEHLAECSACRLELQKEREVITLFEHLPELRCPEGVLRKIETATLVEEKEAAPIRKSKFVFTPLRWPASSAVLAAAVIILLVVVLFFPGQKTPPSAQFSRVEVVNARNAAKWSLAYAAATMSQENKKIVEGALGEYLPRTVRSSLRNATL